MRPKIMTIIVFLLALGFMATAALADKLVCISGNTRGEMTIAQCLAEGHACAVIDRSGVPRILSRDELEVFKKLNPGALTMKAYSIPYLKEAPEIPQIKDYTP